MSPGMNNRPLVAGLETKSHSTDMIIITTNIITFIIK
jgi:hypothetical protein